MTLPLAGAKTSSPDASVATTDAPAAPLTGHVSYQVSDSSYRICVGDVLSISVYPQEEYSANDIIVRSDGKATFPKIGEVDTYGKTIAELSSEITGDLSSTLRNHTVTISVTSTQPAIFYLTGAVNHAGPFQMDNATPGHRLDLVLSNVLGSGGGVALNADLSHVQVKHRYTGEVKEVDLWKVLREGSVDNDPWLNPGDSVYVPELPKGSVIDDDDFKLLANSVLSPKDFPVRVIGEVHTPSLVKMDGQTPLLSTAIAMAGGFNPAAMTKVVAVRRFTDNNHFSTLFVDTTKMDFMLRPNDIVYVGESKFYKTGRFMQEAAQIMAPFTEAATIGANASQTFGFGGWGRLMNGGH